MEETWRERLERGRVLLDGGLGSSLIATGKVVSTHVAGAAFTAPEELLEVHRGFIAAGAEALLTNTFGASRPALAEGKHGERWQELNGTSVRLARRAAAEAGGAFVLGDLGPIGFWAREGGGARHATLDSGGQPSLDGATASAPPADIAQAYREQAEILVGEGVDGLFVETLPGEVEGRLALDALREVTDLPITLSVTTIRRGGSVTTLAGEPVAEVLARFEEAGADAVGLNCGEGSRELLDVLPACCAAVSVPLVAKPNAGLPTPGEFGPVYGQEPEAFAADLARALLLGVNAVGGCCGADARFIAALRACFGDR